MVFFAFQPEAIRSDEAGIQISQGEIEGANYAVAKPANWQGKLLIFAHGYRPDSAALSAEIDTDKPQYSQLLEAGWMIAMTSYRRNGIIIDDAIADIENLRRYIEVTFSKPSQTLLMGDSMGGAIGVLIAENYADHYDGVLAVGAALRAREDIVSPGISHQPGIPLLFLSNQDEVEQPAEYVRKSAATMIAPALWTVKRDGHVNVNDDERTAALMALEQFIETGNIERDKDGTLSGKLQSSTVSFTPHGAIGNITEVTDGYGNFFTSYLEADFEKLGIKRNDFFDMTVGDLKLKVYFGATYADVDKGEWIAFVSPQGNIMFARNYENACKTVNCKVSDELIISNKLLD
jgi:pimeloyl-ACP methyl ester carboxylesterase